MICCSIVAALIVGLGGRNANGTTSCTRWLRQTITNSSTTFFLFIDTGKTVASARISQADVTREPQTNLLVCLFLFGLLVRKPPGSHTICIFCCALASQQSYFFFTTYNTNMILVCVSFVWDGFAGPTAQAGFALIGFCYGALEDSRADTPRRVSCIARRLAAINAIRRAACLPAKLSTADSRARGVCCDEAAVCVCYR